MTEINSSELFAFLNAHGKDIGRKAREDDDPICQEIVHQYQLLYNNPSDDEARLRLSDAIEAYQSQLTAAQRARIALSRHIQAIGRKRSGLRQQIKNGVSLAPYTLTSLRIFRQIRQSTAFIDFVPIARQLTQSLPDTYHGHKYVADLNRYWFENSTRLALLSLHRSPPMRILDLGCGTGYFMVLCQLFEHQVVGLDLANNVIYDSAIDFFGLQRVSEAIRPNHPLPKSLTAFDLITAFSIDFDEYSESTTQHWATAEWRSFLADIHTRLNPRGRVFLRINLSKYGLGSIQAYPEFTSLLDETPLFDVEYVNHRDIVLSRIEK